MIFTRVLKVSLLFALQLVLCNGEHTEEGASANLALVSSSALEDPPIFIILRMV